MHRTAQQARIKGGNPPGFAPPCESERDPALFSDAHATWRVAARSGIRDDAAPWEEETGRWTCLAFFLPAAYPAQGRDAAGQRPPALPLILFSAERGPVAVN